MKGKLIPFYHITQHSAKATNFFNNVLNRSWRDKKCLEVRGLNPHTAPTNVSFEGPTNLFEFWINDLNHRKVSHEIGTIVIIQSTC